MLPQPHHSPWRMGNTWRKKGGKGQPTFSGNSQGSVSEYQHGIISARDQFKGKLGLFVEVTGLHQYNECE